MLQNISIKIALSFSMSFDESVQRHKDVHNCSPVFWRKSISTQEETAQVLLLQQYLLGVNSSLIDSFSIALYKILDKQQDPLT